MTSQLDEIKNENLQPGTEPVDGYAYDADTWCEQCLRGAINNLPEHELLAPVDDYIDGNVNGCMPTDNGETDSPDHCNACFIPLHCQLTTVGVEYVKEKIAEGDGLCIELWKELFKDYLD